MCCLNVNYSVQVYEVFTWQIFRVHVSIAQESIFPFSRIMPLLCICTSDKQWILQLESWRAQISIAHFPIGRLLIILWQNQKYKCTTFTCVLHLLIRAYYQIITTFLKVTTITRFTGGSKIVKTRGIIYLHHIFDSLRQTTHGMSGNFFVRR